MKKPLGKNFRSAACLATLSVLSGAGDAQAAVIADLRADYVAGTTTGQTTQTVTANPLGVSDSSGTGVWNLYRMDYNASGDLDNPSYDGVLTLLPWNTGHFSGSYVTGIATVSANEIWDGMAPGANELAWHGGGVPGDPFNSTKRNTVVRWTAGASAPATVDLSGSIRLPYSGWSAKTITIYVNGVSMWDYTALSSVDTSNSVSHSYHLTGIAITSGTTIDYVLESGSGGRAALSAQIVAIPEPTALGMLGLAAGVLALRRRRVNG